MDVNQKLIIERDGVPEKQINLRKFLANNDSSNFSEEVFEDLRLQDTSTF